MNIQDQKDIFIRTLKTRNLALFVGNEVNPAVLDMSEQAIDLFDYRWKMLVQNRRVLHKMHRNSKIQMLSDLISIAKNYGFNKVSKAEQNKIEQKFQSVVDNLISDESEYGEELYMKIANKTLKNSSIRVLISDAKRFIKETKRVEELEKKTQQELFRFYHKKSVDYGIIANSFEEMIQLVDQKDLELQIEARKGEEVFCYNCKCRKYVIGESTCSCGLKVITIRGRRTMGETYGSLSEELDFELMNS